MDAGFLGWGKNAFEIGFGGGGGKGGMERRLPFAKKGGGGKSWGQRKKEREGGIREPKSQGGILKVKK